MKCSFCGAKIKDIDERCPECGAINPDFSRQKEKASHKNPQTIEELQEWYRARKLPPSHVTRFFIGVNISEPKAFGIYENNGTYIVYKNKADGSRAIRYQGNDEAYAVNELYERLKQEIANQKSHNVKKTVYTGKNGRAMVNKKIDKTMIAIVVGVFLLFALPVGWSLGSYLYEEAHSPISWRYYLDDNDKLYYYYGYYSNNGERGYRWYVYDSAANDWSDCLTSSEEEFPEGLDYKSRNYYSYYDIEPLVGSIDDYASYEEFEKAASKYNIRLNKFYIDDGNHYEPYDGYYNNNGRLFYYMEDMYGDSYGGGDKSGWYLFDEDSNEWEFYSLYDNRDNINDDMWYYPDDFYLGEAYEDFTTNNSTVSDFGYTSYYQEMLKAEESYIEYREQQKQNDSDSGSSFWSSDSDYDWSSSDSWSSDYTDWDSDW